MTDWSVRPNQLFAISLDYSPLEQSKKKYISISQELVTPKGIRSLSPKSGGYNPIFAGPPPTTRPKLPPRYGLAMAYRLLP